MFAEKVALNLLREELLTIVNNYQGDYEFFVDTDFKKYEKEIKSKQIFFIISVDQGQIDHESEFVNCNINCISFSENIDLCREVFNAFTNAYNLVGQTRDNYYIIQAYTNPATNSNFNRLQNGYGSLLSSSATFQLTTNASVISKIELYNATTDTWQVANFLNVNFQYNGNPDSKPFPTTLNAITKSVVQFGTIAISIQTYFKLNNPLIASCLNITKNDLTQDNNFKIRLTINDLLEPMVVDNLKLIQFELAQQHDKLPACAMTFSQ